MYSPWCQSLVFFKPCVLQLHSYWAIKSSHLREFAMGQIKYLLLLRLWSRKFCVELFYGKPEEKKGRKYQQRSITYSPILSHRIKVGRDFCKYFHHNLWRLLAVSERQEHSYGLLPPHLINRGIYFSSLQWEAASEATRYTSHKDTYRNNQPQLSEQNQALPAFSWSAWRYNISSFHQCTTQLTPSYFPEHPNPTMTLSSLNFLPFSSSPWG